MQNTQKNILLIEKVRRLLMIYIPVFFRSRVRHYNPPVLEKVLLFWLKIAQCHGENRARWNHHPGWDQLRKSFWLFLPWLLFVILDVRCFAQPWQRHTIDDSLVGADGVRLGDFNQDGLKDIVTGWEESGIVRLYLNPGPSQSKNRWPAVTVGKFGSPEDAVPFDTDGDGKFEIVSCHEGKTKAVYVHRFQGKLATSELLKPGNWRSSKLNQMKSHPWMFATPIRISSEQQALVIGSKGKSASLTLLRPQAREPIEQWPAKKLRDCGWIMTIQSIDMDQDGDQDVVFSDRKTKTRRIGWLEQPSNLSDPWHEHQIGGSQLEPMFIDANPDSVVAATRNNRWLQFQKSGQGTWSLTENANPSDVPFGKAIRKFGNSAVVMTANTASDRGAVDKPAVWIFRDQEWQPLETITECKFDRIELIDLDGDGDLDLLTCEERKRLGVIWYENPNAN